MNLTLKPLLVELLPEDVERGEPGRSDRCPVALAVRRSLGERFPDWGNSEASLLVEVPGPQVSVRRWPLANRTDHWTAPLPRAVTEWIRSFDSWAERDPGGKLALPSPFSLALPGWASQEIPMQD